MKARMRTVMGLVLASVASAAACGGSGMTSYAPTEDRTKYPADVLLGAARKAAEEEGNVVVTGDSPDVLDTREKSVAVSSVPRLSYRYSFHVETKGGLLEISSACTENSALSESKFEDCGSDRPERVVKELAALRKRTLELAPHVQSLENDWSTYGKEDAKEDASDAKGDKADAKGDKADAKGDKADAKGDKADAKGDKADAKGDKADGAGKSGKRPSK